VILSRQLADPALKEIISALSEGRPPLLSPPLSLHSHSLRLLNGLACISLAPRRGFLNDHVARILLPLSLRRRVMRQAHAHKLSGHLGAFKTVERIRQFFWWPKIDSDVQAFIDACPSCQQSRRRSLASPPLLLFSPLLPLPILASTSTFTAPSLVLPPPLIFWESRMRLRNSSASPSSQIKRRLSSLARCGSTGLLSSASPLLSSPIRARSFSTTSRPPSGRFWTSSTRPRPRSGPVATSNRSTSIRPWLMCSAPPSSTLGDAPSIGRFSFPPLRSR
jgi:hypothetical protein